MQKDGKKVAVVRPILRAEEPRRRQVQRVEDVAINFEGAQRQPMAGEELYVGYWKAGCTAIFFVLLIVVAIVFYVRFA
ncbi:hypothetical protein CRE_24906 [Caenorhabditis remanei]|uniref:Uncharacterized protein n=1 Tax=Caenorhabditis remanei TaxID=31234 RepID=E3MHZ2_CAERE|nr:hypothetical protein CRE_24906 [Caenorhabditis remanei]